jgi:hypothetical protein
MISDTRAFLPASILLANAVNVGYQVYIGAGRFVDVNPIGELVDFEEVRALGLQNCLVVLLEHVALLDALDRLDRDLFENALDESAKLT